MITGDNQIIVMKESKNGGLLLMNNCIVAQSGGPTVAINASLSGVIEKAAASGSDVYKRQLLTRPPLSH